MTRIAVNPTIRIAANLLLSAVLGGLVAYLSWLLLPIAQWASISGGVAVVIMYWGLWFGSTDDSENA